MNAICGYDRYELIAKAREEIIESTNIENSQEEMAVLDITLFRCWQMGWLDQLRDGGDIRAKNARLQELASKLLKDTDDTFTCFSLNGSKCEKMSECVKVGQCYYEKLANELGIEVQ